MIQKRVVFFLGMLLLSAACANGGDATLNDGGGTDGSKPKTDGSNPNDSGGGGMCVPSCATDQDCQSSCPAAPMGAINCCDLTTNTCYTPNNSTCPSGGPDGGGD